MNQFIEYVCRGVIRSEDAIKNLNKKVVGLAKCHRKLSVGIICVSVAGLLLTSVVAAQDKEIQALKKQVADLIPNEEPEENSTEEKNDLEGA
jgi:hypothetical protein